MAMMFSEEEQERLQEDKSEIYQKRDEETNKDDVRNLSTKGKIQQFMDYYFKSVLIAIVVIGVIITGMVQATTKKPENALYVAIQNDVIPEENINAFEKVLEKYYRLDTDKEIVTVRMDCDDQTLQTYLYAGTVDVVIMEEENYKRWAQAEYFLDVETDKEMAFCKKYDKEYLFRSQYITGEDILKNDRKEVSETKPSDEEFYTNGVYLTDSEKYKQLGGAVAKPVIGISTASNHVTDAKEFVKYMMDNEKKMKLESTDFSKE